MTATMLVSIIIPSFRQPQFLRAAIGSALAQDHPDVEVIVVDDGSGDASLAIAMDEAARDRRVRVINRSTNGGLGRARNTGLAFATGDLVTFLDADDCLYPDGVRRRVERFRAERETNTRCVGVFGDWQHTTEAVDLPPPRNPRPDVASFEAASFIGENGFICSAPLVDRTAVVAAGGFAEDLPLFEDFALWTRMIAAGGVFVYEPVMVSTYRQRAASMLRRADVIGGRYATAIVKEAVASGLRLNSPGQLADLSRSPRAGQRLGWLRSTEWEHRRDFGHASTVVVPSDSPEDHHSVSAEITIPRCTEQELLSRAGEASDAALRPDATDGSEFVVEVTGLESVLETTALLDGLRRSGGPVPAIAIADPTRLDVTWPLALTEATVESTASAASRHPSAHWIVFGDDRGPRKDFLRGLGKDRCTIRTSGLSALRLFEPHAAKHFREAHRVLVRSPLEAAELGDRPVTMLGSAAELGAALLWGPPEHSDELVVICPSEIAEDTDADYWLSIVLTAATRAGCSVRMMSDAPDETQRRGFRLGPIDLSACRNARLAITAVGPLATLLESLGVATTLFEPAIDTTISGFWRRTMSIATTTDELVSHFDAAVSDRPSPTSEDRDIASLRQFGGDTTEFARQLMSRAGGADR